MRKTLRQEQRSAGTPDADQGPRGAGRSGASRQAFRPERPPWSSVYWVTTRAQMSCPRWHAEHPQCTPATTSSSCTHEPHTTRHQMWLALPAGTRIPRWVLAVSAPLRLPGPARLPSRLSAAVQGAQDMAPFLATLSKSPVF